MKQFTFLFFVCTFSLTVFAQLKLPSVISDNMVLQRETDVPIWGWTKPESKVTVKFMDQIKSTTADKAGEWKICFDPMPAIHKPQKMIIESDKNIVTLTNILVGEVWVCSGQSNMERSMGHLNNAEKEIADANDSKIRFFAIKKFNFKPYESDDCEGQWIECSSKIAKKRTAVGYYFAQELRKKIDVPIGLIEAYFGGSSIGAWTSERVLKKWPELQGRFDRREKYNTKKKYDSLINNDKEKWINELKKFDKGFADNWMDSKVSSKGWEKIMLPVLWNSTKKLKNFKGTVWFRKTFYIPENWKNKKLMVTLGSIKEYDFTWLNGKEIGMMQVPYLSWLSRRYKVDNSDYKIGKNTIVICDYNKKYGGGIICDEDNMQIFPEGEPENAISLDGEWFYKIGYSGTELSKAPIPFLLGQHNLSTLYNSKISPIIPFGIKGVIWYQGESNQGNPYEYREMFPDLIGSWRDDWSQGNFPFYYVQIAPYNYNNKINSALLREAQLLSMKVTNTGMAVTMDIGNPNDIHPKNKKDVGKRLALWALAKNYGFTNIVFSGPVYKKMKVDGNKILLSFDYADGLKTRDGKAPSHFEIAGIDKKFFPAIAEIKNEKIVVFNHKIKNPIAVRYGWSDVAEPNLCNQSNLPASSFRTDKW